MWLDHQAIRGGLAGVPSIALLVVSASCRAASLGGAPVCEASAIQAVACPAGDERTCWLVGDNEVSNRVFVYEMQGDTPKPDLASRRAMEISEISDIEALARTRDGDVLVYGSHSRNKRCRVRENRRVFTSIRLTEQGAVPGARTRVASPDIDWRSVFADAATEGTLARVRDAVARGEAAADAGDCGRRFDIEAAVVVPGAQGDEVWLGLRTPIVDGHAVLLRHDISAGALRFVDARLLDLGGWGVRALDHDGGRVYGLSPAGPDDAQDVEQAAFRLWWFPAERLNGPDPIAVLPLADVPPRSEGVAIHAGHAIVVQDGDEGSPNCDEDSSYTLIPLR